MITNQALRTFSSLSFSYCDEIMAETQNTSSTFPFVLPSSEENLTSFVYRKVKGKN